MSHLAKLLSTAFGVTVVGVLFSNGFNGKEGFIGVRGKGALFVLGMVLLVGSSVFVIGFELEEGFATASSSSG
jgi:hypothetical protein